MKSYMDASILPRSLVVGRLLGKCGKRCCDVLPVMPEGKSPNHPYACASLRVEQLFQGDECLPLRRGWPLVALHCSSCLQGVLLGMSSTSLLRAVGSCLLRCTVHLYTTC
jgi:hypothetical protein